MQFLRHFLVLLIALAGTVLCCNGPESGSDGFSAVPAGRAKGSPNAHWDVVQKMQQDRGAKRHPSDGGGRAWIEQAEGENPGATASEPGRWSIVYESGPLGVSEGGRVFLIINPYWHWSYPQDLSPEVPGYTTVSTTASGLDLEIERFSQYELAVTWSGGSLDPGERLVFVYGAGKMGALADRYAERDARFWIAVDGDGDGVRKVLADSPGLDVAPGPPALLLLTLPSTARLGQTVRLTAAILDRMGNAGCPVAGEIIFNALPDGLDMPDRIRLAPPDRGRTSVDITVEKEGIYWLSAIGPQGLAATSNPMVADTEIPRILWADLQIHSNFSDGTGVPEDLYIYARDVAGLDAAAVTDHDHWGMLFLDQHPSLWEEIGRQAERFNDPDRFVTFLGYEWTSWIHGHRHVLYPGNEGEVFSSIDPSYDDPEELFDALRGYDAATLTHHTAGSPVATNWTIPPDPVLETVTEIVSVHGSGEAADSPHTVPGAIRGNFVRDALDRGYRLGFVGSGDGHDGHPGLAHLGAPTGGLAAIMSEELNRESILHALRTRRVYATSGPRIVLNVTLNDYPIGSSIPAPLKQGRLKIRVVAPGGIRQIDLVRSGKVVRSLAGQGRRVLSIELPVENLRPAEYLYLRVIQENTGLAYTSPFYFD
ncbi:CehA/McbA family metallohydrolase [Acidobacteriota bacterium]